MGSHERIEDWLAGELAAIDEAGLRRHLRHVQGPPGPWIDIELDDGTERRVLHLCSNSYLGLAGDPRVVAAAATAAEHHGTGTGASRLITGSQQPHRDLEEDLADWQGKEAATLFSSGYLANLGLLTTLAGPGDTIVSDERNHASVIDGCRLSRASVRVYGHGDVEHAERLLSDAPGRRLLVTDGVFSMDGDVAPIAALCDVAERHGAMVVVDDAHGVGVLGPEGAGTVAASDCTERVTAIVSTLSKSLASSGGVVVGSRNLVDLVRNRARSFIFDTALGAPSVGAAHAAVRIARTEPDRRTTARRHAATLAAELRRLGLDVLEPAACIVPVLVGDNQRALDLSRRLLEEGVLAVAIRPPTVAPGSARLRLTTMATHTDDDIQMAIKAFDLP
ncbi:MAG: 8-amino-7-oxononanoate synthase [Nitriliruptorales bacterium]|nr:8-amino-7-oxononanoate synthase [Nitriliruptorales bacterium]